MTIRGSVSPIDIAVSGMRAEGMRLRVIANNIANAQTTRTPDGQPYRRQDLSVRTGGRDLEGVTIERVIADTRTDFRSVYQPGHPDADANGFVQMPNVDIPMEMMEMVMASRAYQANVAVMKRHQDMSEVTTELLR